MLYLSGVLAIGIVALVACTPGPQGDTDNGFPPAQTPLYLYLAVPFVDDSGHRTWEGVTPSPPGPASYPVLPLSIAPKVQVIFSAPYPSKFHMTATISEDLP